MKNLLKAWRKRKADAKQFKAKIDAIIASNPPNSRQIYSGLLSTLKPKPKQDDE
jgi:hypothetical protein